MTTSIRFENAILKLYNAFHNGSLNPEDCKQCAVGNILDNNESWKYFTDKHGSLQLNYIGLVHQNLGKQFNGYSPIQLLQIESAFLKGCGYHFTTKQRLYRPKNINKTILFNGLSDVVAQLCTLDGIDNIMDCSILFNFDIANQQHTMV